MAGHGALCEAGWELQDLATRAWQLTFGGEDGKAKNPVALVVIMCIHHAMGLCMIIPMNIHHSSNPSYHEFVFLLQFAAFVALGAGNYGSSLDIETTSGLFQMKIVCTIVLLVMTYRLEPSGTKPSSTHTCTLILLVMTSKSVSTWHESITHVTTEGV